MPAGLGKNSKKVYSAYHRIIKSYEKTNMLITFFQVNRWRKFIINSIAEEIRKLHIKRPLVLDAGAGPGFMGYLFNRQIKSNIILLDYSIEMLENSIIDCNKVQGLFEALPFRDKCFDVVLSGFAFHASIDMNKSASEFARVNKYYTGLVSIGKSRNKIKQKLGAFYIYNLIPIIARLSAGSNYKEFKKISEIYKSIPNNNELLTILKKYYNIEIFKQKAFDTIYQIIAKSKNNKK